MSSPGDSMNASDSPKVNAMNKVLSLVRATRHSFGPGPGLLSDPMFSELLHLHEEMIAQLRLERVKGVVTSEFLSGMIDQHEYAAAKLRVHLHPDEAKIA